MEKGGLPKSSSLPSSSSSPSPSEPANGSGTFKIQIRTLDGKTVRVDAEREWTVQRLKEEFAKWKGEGWERVNLHYKAKRLDNKDRLSKYNIDPDGFVLANIRSSGGLHTS